MKFINIGPVYLRCRWEGNRVGWLKQRSKIAQMVEFRVAMQWKSVHMHPQIVIIPPQALDKHVLTVKAI